MRTVVLVCFTLCLIISHGITPSDGMCLKGAVRRRSRVIQLCVCTTTNPIHCNWETIRNWWTLPLCQQPACPNVGRSENCLTIIRREPCPAAGVSTQPSQDTVTVTSSTQPSQDTVTVTSSTQPSQDTVNLTSREFNSGTSCANNDIPLGILIGLLTLILVATVMGWVCTCVVMSSRRAPTNNSINIDTGSQQLQSRLDNPVYNDTPTQPHPSANYSSHGPTYDHVSSNEEMWHAYDVINQKQQLGRDSKPPHTQQQADNPPGNLPVHHIPEGRHQPPTGIDPSPNPAYNVPVEHHQPPTGIGRSLNPAPTISPDGERYYYVLESSAQSEVKGRSCDPEGIDNEPLDYEVPRPLTKP